MKPEIEKPKKMSRADVALIAAPVAFVLIGAPVMAYYDGKTDGRREAATERHELKMQLIDAQTEAMNAIASSMQAHHNFQEALAAGRECLEVSQRAVAQAEHWKSYAEAQQQPKLLTDTATFWSREYQTIRIESPGYECKRDGNGWTCERGEP